MPVHTRDQSFSGADMVLQVKRLWSPGDATHDRTLFLSVSNAAACIGGVVLALVCTSRYGVGTSPDSASYFAAARSLLAEGVYLYPDGRTYTHWPPLFPTLLAAFGLIGIEVHTAARLLNSFAFGAIVYVSGKLFSRCMISQRLALLGTLSILLSTPLLAVSITALSEPVFILLAVSFAACLPGFLRKKDLASLVGISIIAGLACLQRYTGVTIILAGSLLIAIGVSKASFLQRLKYLAVFWVISVTPIALWFLRNHLVAGQTTGAHHFHLTSGQELIRAFHPAFEVMTTWLLPQKTSLPVRWAVAATLIVVGGILSVMPCREHTGRDNTRVLQAWVAMVLGLSYFGFLVLSGAGLSWNPNERHMASLYVFVLLLVFAGIDRAGNLLYTLSGHRKWLPFVGLALCALWLVYHPLGVSHRTMKRCLRDGAGGYSTSHWQESPLLEWLRNHPLPGTVYSNVADALYLLTGQQAEITPHHGPAAEFARRMNLTETTHVVWSHHLRRDYLYDLRELRSRYRMEEVATFPDGCVYRVLSEGGVALSGVYRFWSPQTNGHFYTADKAERDRWVNADTWVYEGAVFYAFIGADPADTLPVYRLRSTVSGSCFYTMEQSEKDELLTKHAGIWLDEGIAFYAYPEQGEDDDRIPVHHFRSGDQRNHFYTASGREKDKLMNAYSQAWTYKGIVWYVYGP